MRSPSRLFRLAAALLIAGTAAPAAAQTDCAPSALSTYIGASCDLAGWRFTDFFLSTDATADGPTTSTAPLTDGSDVLVTPFATTVGGVTRFGFRFENLLIESTALGGQGSSGFAAAQAIFGFLASSIGGTGTMGRAGFDVALFGATETPGRTELYQLATGAIFDQHPPGGSAGECANRFIENFGPGDKPRSVFRRCEAPNPTAIGAAFILETEARRSDSPRVQEGVSRAQLSLVAFQSVPEPTTVALVATGALALAGVARRRRG
jgi:hypothetical protein